MEQAEGSIDIDAPLEDVMEVIEDYESYPEWADVKRVEIRERGEGSRATEVAFEVDVPVLGKASYVLRYQYARGDAALSWTSVEAHGAVRDIRGEYLLNELDDGATTRVVYRLDVELGPLVPGFIRA
jgi:carbon monoxide dehydrogenase subunit G